MAGKIELVKPMSEFEKIFIEEINEEIDNRYDMEGKCGKWMLFFRRNVMDCAWEKSCQLYNDGKLPGIAFIKTSTAANISNVYDQHKGVIIFYCGPSDNEDLMMEYGRALVDQLSYTSQYGCITYKTDEQTNLGTRTTGRKINHIYSMKVPKKLWLPYDGHFIENDSGEDIIPPSTITTQTLLSIESTGSMSPKCDLKENRPGCWKMNIKESDLDEVWSTAVQLYRQKKLHGVLRISINTAMETFHPDKIILFYCLPGNVRIIKMYGRNILKYMAKYNCGSCISYKVRNAPGKLTYQLENWETDVDDYENTDLKEVDSLASNFNNLDVIHQ